MTEFETVFDYGGRRLALDPTGDLCVAASWMKGTRGGVAGYDARSGERVWHRPDRGVPGLRFSSAGDVIWCPVGCHGPVWRLDARTGETLTELREVEDVLDSPYSNCMLETRRDDFRIKGPREFRVPRLTFAFLDASFSPDSLCVSESGGPVRCFECMSGHERWRYQPPSGCHVIKLFYCEPDQSFYGVEWNGEHGGPEVFVRRISQQTGASAEVCRLESFPFDWCFYRDVIVSAAGDVVSLTGGKILKHLEFPQRDYPDPPAQ